MAYFQSDVAIWIHITVIVTLTLVLQWLVNRSVKRVIDHHGDKENFDPTNARFLRRILSVVILLIGFGLVIFFIPSLKHVATTLLAGAGVLVAVLGFASQQVLSNIISGIMIVVTKPYRIQDRITLRDMQGVVEDITLRHTVIRDYRNKRIIIPNALMGNEVITNANHSDDMCCEWVEMNIAYTADIKKARALMQEEILASPYYLDHRTQKQRKDGEESAPVRVVSVGDFAITLRAWAWAANPANAFLLGCALRESIKERFEREGIEIPYPYNNVIIKNKTDDKNG